MDKLVQLPMFDSHEPFGWFGCYGAPRKPPEPLGTLTLPFFGRDVTFTGGPYVAKPDGMIGVNMMAEFALENDIYVPTVDYNVPHPLDFERGLLSAAACGLLRSEGVYVGCFGGRGRTGLFMTGLAYMAGVPSPVAYVRKHYHEKAVETVEQEQFVYSFSRHQFRVRLMTALLILDAIDCNWVADMNWRDRLLYQWVKSTIIFRV
jgi:hypothetical protein